MSLNNVSTAFCERERRVDRADGIAARGHRALVGPVVTRRRAWGLPTT